MPDSSFQLVLKKTNMADHGIFCIKFSTANKGCHTTTNRRDLWTGVVLCRRTSSSTSVYVQSVSLSWDSFSICFCRSDFRADACRPWSSSQSRQAAQSTRATSAAKFVSTDAASCFEDGDRIMVRLARPGCNAPRPPPPLPKKKKTNPQKKEAPPPRSAYHESNCRASEANPYFTALNAAVTRLAASGLSNAVTKTRINIDWPACLSPILDLGKVTAAGTAFELPLQTAMLSLQLVLQLPVASALLLHRVVAFQI